MMTLDTQVQENEKLKMQIQEGNSQIKNYELFRKDVELIFMQHNIETGTSLNNTLRSLDFSQPGSEKDQKAVLGKVLDVLQDCLRNVDQAN